MRRKVLHIPFILDEASKLRLLQWAMTYSEFQWLDSNDYQREESSFEAALALGSHTSVTVRGSNAFAQLQQYRNQVQDWLFGYLGYDLKNDLEKLESLNADELDFPDLYFFQPAKILLFKKEEVHLLYLDEYEHELEADAQRIKATGTSQPKPQIRTSHSSGKRIKARMSRTEYLKEVSVLQEHIHRGDIYEVNFCQEFFAEQTRIDPLQTFWHLNSISHPPFAAFFRNHEHYLCSASPERYLRKSGSHIISQPIKGTARRADNAEEDANLISQLESDPKERSENVMIVDLVRNDLSRVARRDSVRVTELCRVYTFRQVHQLISTITAEVSAETDPVEVIKASFPMGSMTGAPKISAMKLIEASEKSKRGLYSGAIGYFTPEGDFDFNVVIRSILYNEKRQYVSFTVGSAITALSDPEREFEECMIKAKAMREVIDNQ